MSDPLKPPRYFVATTDEVRPPIGHEQMLRHMGISPAVSAAFDLMLDDGVPAETAASFAIAEERNGKDPEAWARHFVKLRKVARGL